MLESVTMLLNPLEKYQKLLSKEQKCGDKYVIIDVKWFQHWKRFVGIENSEKEKVTNPGPIDFTQLTEPGVDNSSSDEIQLRSDAVEGNDYTFIPYELSRLSLRWF